MDGEGRTIAVVGSTGLQGGAVSLRLLDQGWRVRALTRNPNGARARELAALGAEVVKADSEDSAALQRTFAGAHGVYSVQNHYISGYDGETRQGVNVGADHEQRRSSRSCWSVLGPIGPTD